ncbi:hypothetical protein TYRP_010870 [Tyrophagus putrescentiae]|nr:hypothetical protein TYRP_010870 [Tyrophagus putrescentiae]
MSPLFIVALLSLCLVLATHAQEETLTMRGLVELKAPYAERDYSTDKIKGFYVDLLDELALIGKFNYTLVEAKNATRNKTASNQVSLDQRQLVNDVYSQRADFALSDKLYKGNHITARHLLFTDTYLVSGFSALVAKERLEDNGVNSLEELFAKNRVRAIQDPEYKGIALGSVLNSNTYTELSLSSDKNIGRRIYEWLYKEEKKFVDTREKGIQQVRDKPFALIELGLDNELAVDEDCDLTALPISFVYANGTKEGVVREYGIAVQKTSSRSLDILNKGIRELKVNGKLDELKRRYWNRKCNGAPSDKVHYVITSMCTLFSLAISLFLLS